MSPEIINSLVPLVAVVMGVSVILIPIAGLTARFALRPVMEALARLRETRGADEHTRLLEARISLLEEQLHGIDRSVRALSEESEFRRQLEAGPSVPAARPAPAPAAETVV